MSLRSSVVFSLFLCLPALASSWSGKAEVYVTYHFGFSFEGKRVKAVLAVPEVVMNDGEVRPGKPTQLKMVGKPHEQPDHFFGKDKLTFPLYHSASGEWSAPKALQVRYLIYHEGPHPLSPVYPLKPGNEVSLYAKGDEEIRKTREGLEEGFAKVIDANETTGLYYTNEHYRKIFSDE